jgi:hypothetical protein
MIPGRPAARSRSGQEPRLLLTLLLGRFRATVEEQSMVTLSQTSAVEDVQPEDVLSSYSIRLPQDSANFRTGRLSEGGSRVWANFHNERSGWRCLAISAS